MMISSLTRHIILLEAAIEKRAHCGHEGTDVVNINIQVGCAVLDMLTWC